MAEQKELSQAKAVFQTLCNTLDAMDWYYTKNEEEFKISCKAQGDDLPIEIIVNVNVRNGLVILLSHLPFSVPEDRRAAMAVAVSVANYNMVDGSFDYDFIKGHVVFRMTSSFRESLIGKDLFEYMLIISCRTVDEYNDKFFMVCKSKMTNDEILKYIK